MQKSLLKKIKKLHKIFHDGGIKQIHKHEVNPELEKESRENYLYFTLPPALNFQRSSPAMWKSALATWEDSETNYLFFPEEVIKQPIAKVRKDLLKHKLALQPNKHTDIWTKISSTFHTLFKDDPRNLLKEGKYDAGEIITLIQNKYKKHFPYLRGPKMSNYWLYILSQYTDVPFTNLEQISIIPDTHIQKCSVHLGVVKEGATPDVVAEAWTNLLDGSGLIPIDMHPVLWNWSRAGFKPDIE